MLLLTSTAPVTSLALSLPYEYAQTENDMPPPYAFAPEEEVDEEAKKSGESDDVEDEAEQLVKALFDMM